MQNRQIIPQSIAIVIFLIIASALSPDHTAGAQGIPVLPRIITMDTSTFPEIRLRLLLLDQRGGGVSGVSTRSLTVAEDNQPVDFKMQEEESGVEIAFVLDAGMGLYANGAGGETRLEEMKQAILDILADPLRISGKDVVHIIAQEPDGGLTLANQDTPAASIPAILAKYNPDPPDRLARPLDAVGALLDQFGKGAAGNGRAQAIILLSGILQTGPAATLPAITAKARAMGIPIHTVLVREGFELGDNMQTLSARSGGLFKYYGIAGEANIAEIQNVLAGMRRQYVVTYRSNAGQSGTRVVSVAMTADTVGKTALSQYDVTVEPPVAALLSPADNQTVRLEAAPVAKPTTAVEATPQLPAGSPAGISVTGSVSWPDGHPRAIRQAVLLVNGKPRVTLDSPGDGLAFWWVPLPEDGTAGVMRLQIRLEDEFGLTAESKVVPIKIATGWFSALSGIRIPDLLPYLSLIVGLTALGLVVAFRKPLAGTAQAVAGTAAEFVQEVGETLRFHSRAGGAKASLIDLDQRSGWPQSAFELEGTISIGRSGEGAGLQIHSGRDDSPISRVHCTILEEDGAFYVRDEQSANGTSLNGTRLAPLDRQALKDGDIIQLANPDRGGIRLQFRSSRRKPAFTETQGEATCRMDRT